MPTTPNMDQGDVITLPLTPAASLNAIMFGPMDMTAWDWLTVYIGSSTYSGQISIQGTNDPTDSSSWVTLQMWRADTLAIANIVLDSVTYASRTGPVRFPWLQIVMSSYSSGTAVGSIELRRASRAMSLAAQYATLLSSPGMNVGNVGVANTDNIALLASAAITTNANGADQTNQGAKGGKFFVTTGSFGAGASAITATIQGKDPVTGNYYTILQSASLSASSFVVLSVYPGLPVTSNISANDILPNTWRLIWNASAWGTGGSTLGISCALNG